MLRYLLTEDDVGSVRFGISPLCELGLSLRAIKEPAFFMYPTGFVDRFSSFDVKAFLAKVNSVVAGLHADGSLKKLSIKDFFGKDYATKAGQFDLATIGQTVK